jgi:hypothetical protein
MTIIRLTNDEKGITPVFEHIAVRNDEKSKKEGRPIFDQVEHVRIHIAGMAKEKVPVYPAHDVSHYQMVEDGYGGQERKAVTYAERFNKQYLEFKAGGKQSFSGTPLDEVPFLNEAKRRELRALHIYTAENLASLDGSQLKMLGPGGRELKNQAEAYLEKAQQSASSGELADALAKRDSKIEELERKLAALTGEAVPEPEEKPPADTEAAFETFTDDDLANWLKEAGVTVDGRWSRVTMLAKAGEELAKHGKKKAA